MHHHGRGAEVDEESAAVAEGRGLLLQDTQHLFVRERASALHGQQFVAPAPVVRQVAAVAAAEGAQLALVRLLAGVRAHVGFQVALVGRRERAQVAAVRLLSCRWRRAASVAKLGPAVFPEQQTMDTYPCGCGCVQ